MLEKLLEILQSEKDAYHALSALLGLVKAQLKQYESWWDDDYLRILSTLHTLLQEEYGRVSDYDGDDPPAILDSWPPRDELGRPL